MKVALRTDGPRRRWHQRLGERLATQGYTLVVVGTEGRRLPAGLRLVLAMEHRLYGRKPMLFAAVGDASCDEDSDVALEVRFDGEVGERALVDALLSRRVPRVDIVDTTGRVLAAGLPAVEAPESLACGLDHVLARTGQLVATAVRGAGEAPSLQSALSPLARGVTTPALFGLGTLLSKLRGKLVPADARMPPWRMAVRSAGEPGAALARSWAGALFLPLEHDRGRFQADPFVLAHHGRTCLFFEEFPFATRRGVIAMRELSADGHWSPARVVLDEPFHLSYPHLFVWEGEVFMLPEAAASGCIRLYRADPFPDRFIPDRILVDEIEAGDATLVEHGGRWWLFATLAGDGGSTWDALGLFHAPHPFGPWTPHAANPVLVDAGAARPGGEMWHEGGALMRVAQDCRAGYGAGLAICRVDRLDPGAYAQTVIGRLAPPPGLARDGVHTLNRAAGFEVIDLL